MALAKAKKEMIPVRKEGVTVKQNGSTKQCNLIVRPITGLSPAKERLFLVLFEEVKVSDTNKNKKNRKFSKKDLQLEERRSNRLEQELVATKEYLQSLNQEHQKTNDALASANESPSLCTPGISSSQQT